ncbi:hypothetical protein K32_24020 [Kaistia sp. 32K]|uniref:hypothetical protein n=1 Tax=Kaistia sp. 32K TaxID=2795690 RepID=UPI001915BAD4|nr:hypothetical protein [Kaistia sp. 32K]BCP53785.1 hypothetical protein K32_24020 [Kaistia sp. 32K]
MRIYPAQYDVPLVGPNRQRVDPVAGIEVNDNDLFWNRRIRAGEASTTPPVAPAADDKAAAAG